MKKPIFRSAFECKDIGQGYIFTEDEAEMIESNVMVLKKGESSNVGLHDDEEEVYIVLAGRGQVRIGDETQVVEPGTVMYVPRDAEHVSTGLSDEDYIYMCVAVYLKKVPAL